MMVADKSYHRGDMVSGESAAAAIDRGTGGGFGKERPRVSWLLA